MTLVGLLTGCWVLVPRLLNKDAEPGPIDSADPVGWDSEGLDTWEPEDTGWTAPVMEADYVGIAHAWGWNGAPQDYYTASGITLPQTVEAGYYDERFFLDLNPMYSCVEHYLLTDPQPTGEWGTFRFTLEHTVGSTTPCDFGNGPLDGVTLSLGVSQPSPQLIDGFREYLGADYPAWEPYLLASRIGDWEMGWAILLELDDSMRLVPGTNCPMTGMTCRPTSGVNSFGGPTAVFSNALFLIDVNSLLGG
jgi:hypothetical protein